MGSHLKISYDIGFALNAQRRDAQDYKRGSGVRKLVHQRPKTFSSLPQAVTRKLVLLCIRQ